jgi:ribosomal protein S18
LLCNAAKSTKQQTQLTNLILKKNESLKKYYILFKKFTQTLNFINKKHRINKLLTTNRVELKNINNKLQSFNFFNIPKFANGLCHGGLKKKNYVKPLVNNYKQFGYLKMDITKHNVHFTITTFTGQVIAWVSAGVGREHNKRTRMQYLILSALAIAFVKKVKKTLKKIQSPINKIILQMTGTSKRYQRMMARRMRKRLRKRSLVILPFFLSTRKLSFNGCRGKRRRKDA